MCFRWRSFVSEPHNCVCVCVAENQTPIDGLRSHHSTVTKPTRPQHVTPAGSHVGRRALSVFWMILGMSNKLQRGELKSICIFTNPTKRQKCSVAANQWSNKLVFSSLSKTWIRSLFLYTFTALNANFVNV